MQIPLFKPQTEWLPPENFPDLSKYDEIAIDLETKDPDLMKMGSGSVVGKGDVVGIAVAVAGWSGYYPIAHEGCLLYTSPSPRDGLLSRMPSSA